MRYVLDEDALWCEWDSGLVENLDYVDVFHAWPNLDTGEGYTQPLDWEDACERRRARQVNRERDIIGWWGDRYLCGTAAASQFEFELDAWYTPPVSARARGKCEAMAYKRATFRIGDGRRNTGNLGSGNGWKVHRRYQAHGRCAIPRKVDVIDWLNGLYD